MKNNKNFYRYQSKVLKCLAFLIDLFLSVILIFKKRKLKKIPKKILVVKLDHLGDCFLITPIFENLTKLFPEAKIDILCQEASVEIFNNNPFIEKIITYNYLRFWRNGGKKAGFKETKNLFKKIKEERYDLLIDARGEPFTNILGFFSRIPFRVSFKDEVLWSFANLLITYPFQIKETEKNKLIILALGGTIFEWQPKIFLSKNEQKEIDNKFFEILKNKVVFMHVGAGLTFRIWPIEKFIALAKIIKDEFGNHLFVFSGLSENLINKQILNSVNFKIVDLTGQTTLRELYFLISRVKVFIGNDSVLAHFAEALQVPAVEVINCVASVSRWAISGKNTTFVVGKNKSHHCLIDKCKDNPCPNMQSIDEEEVFKKLKTIWIKK